MRGCAGKTTGLPSRDSPSAIRRSRSGRTFASRWTVATTYVPGSCGGRHALPGDRREAKGRVGHHVADDDRAAGHALVRERLRRPLVGTEEQYGEPVDLDPGALLGHRQVAASQARLDVREGNAGGGRRARAREGRARVAQDEHDVGTLGLHHPAERPRQRVDVGGAKVEPVRRLGQAELLEEDLRELVVPVLARVDDDLVDPRLPQRDGERRGLDELRPVADDGEEAHRGQGSCRPHASCPSLSRDPSGSPGRAGVRRSRLRLPRPHAGGRRARGRGDRQRGGRTRARSLGGAAAADVRGRGARALLRSARSRDDAAPALRRPAVGAGRRGRRASRRQLAGPGSAAVLRGDAYRPAQRHAAPEVPNRGAARARPERRAARRVRLGRRRRRPSRRARAQPGAAHARHRRDDPGRPVPAYHPRPGSAADRPGRPGHREDGGRPPPRLVPALLRIARGCAACSSSARTRRSWSTSRTSSRRSARRASSSVRSGSSSTGWTRPRPTRRRSSG